MWPGAMDVKKGELPADMYGVSIRNVLGMYLKTKLFRQPSCAISRIALSRLWLLSKTVYLDNDGK